MRDAAASRLRSLGAVFLRVVGRRLGRLGLVVAAGEFFEQTRGRGDDDAACRDVDLGNDGLDEGDEDLALFGGLGAAIATSTSLMAQALVLRVLVRRLVGFRV